MRLDTNLVRRVERTAAENAASIVGPLSELAPERAASATPVAGGHLVLLGPGMYVNRAIGMALETEPSQEDLDLVEQLSGKAGVDAEIEVCPWASRSLLALTADRGYRAAWFRCTLLRPVEAGDATPPPSDVSVEAVSDDASLAVWQATTAEGFEMHTPEQRAISDLFSRTVQRLDNTTLVVARLGDEPVGAATLSIRDGLAMLGGMSTLPSARRRGVQSALIRHRLARAADQGCDLALCTADPGSTSERNLLRHGFSVAYTRLGLQRPV